MERTASPIPSPTDDHGRLEQHNSDVHGNGHPPAPAALPNCASTANPLDPTALRIQVAAVAAQQAALTELELRLRQQQHALEKQQAEVAAHLDDKRRKLLELNRRTQSARRHLVEMRKENAVHFQRTQQELDRQKHELAEAERDITQRREKLKKLYKRLTQRAATHWEVQKAALAERKEELVDACRYLEREFERLEEQQRIVTNNCIRFNTELELGRRRMQQEWNRLQRAQQQGKPHHDDELQALRSRLADIEQREAIVLEAEILLARERVEHQRRLDELRREAQGLEHRIRNQRALLDQLKQQQHKEVAAKNESTAIAQADDRIYPIALPFEAWRPEFHFRPAKKRINRLEQLLAEVTQQQNCLIEQCYSLLVLRNKWEMEQREVQHQILEIVEALRRQTLRVQDVEKQLTVQRGQCERERKELSDLRQQLLTWRAVLRSEQSIWQNKHVQIMQEVREQQSAAQYELDALVALNQRWVVRLQEEQKQYADQRKIWEDAAADYLRISAEYRRQMLTLAEEQHALHVRELAVERFRQETLAQSRDPVQAERRIARLERELAARQKGMREDMLRYIRQLESDLHKLLGKNQDLYQQLQEVMRSRETLLHGYRRMEQQWSILRAAQEATARQLENAQKRLAFVEADRSELAGEVDQLARLLIGNDEAVNILGFDEALQASMSRIEKAA